MKFLLLGTVFLFMSASCIAGVDVIVHPSNASGFDKNMIKKLFTGKAKSFSDGERAIPIIQEDGSDVTKEFNSKVVKKSSSQLKAYWSKLIFTGKGTPPKSVGNDQEVIDLIAKNPSMIGLVSQGSGGDAVKVVHSF